jgi:hypothetical protein
VSYCAYCGEKKIQDEQMLAECARFSRVAATKKKLFLMKCKYCQDNDGQADEMYHQHYIFHDIIDLAKVTAQKYFKDFIISKLKFLKKC